MVSNRRVLFLYKLEINRIERIYRFKRGTVRIIATAGLDSLSIDKTTPHARPSI